MTPTVRHGRSPWLRLLLILCLHLSPVQADQRLVLALGDLNDFDYLSDLLTEVLQPEGYQVEIRRVTNVPNIRLEWMLEQGLISAMMMGETPSRSRRFLPIHVAMTDNLIGHRILFIPRGRQHLYRHVQTLEDFRNLDLMTAMGERWLDYRIWQENGLSVRPMSGDWKRLFGMVAAGNRGIDYLSRGANEIVVESPDYPELDVEQHLTLVYRKDHLLYVSPRQQLLFHLLNRLLPQAEADGTIRRLVRRHFPEVYEPPVSLDQRRVIPLALPD